MARVKVLGTTMYAPAEWNVTAAANGSRQVRMVAAVTSKRAFLDALHAAGLGHVNMYTLSTVGCEETGNEHEVAAAMSEPGAVFHQTDAARMNDRTYVKAATR